MKFLHIFYMYNNKYQKLLIMKYTISSIVSLLGHKKKKTEKLPNK